MANALVGNREAAKNTYFQMGKEAFLLCRGLANYFCEKRPPTQEGAAFKQRMMKENYAQYCRIGWMGPLSNYARKLALHRGAISAEPPDHLRLGRPLAAPVLTAVGTQAGVTRQPGARQALLHHSVLGAASAELQTHRTSKATDTTRDCEGRSSSAPASPLNSTQQM